MNCASIRRTAIFVTALVVTALVSTAADAFQRSLVSPSYVINVSAALTPAPRMDAPHERNLHFAPVAACSTCFEADRQAAMEIRVSTQPIVNLLGPDFRGPKMRWTGSKSGFTEHNLRMRVSRNRGALNWESKF